MVNARPNVVIVGGGIGGLFTAKALIAHGLTVSVYEQAPELGEVGAGVYLTPNSVRQMQRVGLGPAVEKWGARVGFNSQYFRDDGSPIAPVQVTDLSGWNATYGMHRADFVDFLAAALPAGVVRTGHRAVGFEQTDDNGEGDIRQRRDRRGGHCDRRRRHPFGNASFRLSAVQAGVLGHRRLSRHRAART